MKKNLKLLIIFLLLLISVCLSQEHTTHSSRDKDPENSVYGPPQPPEWEFQIAVWTYNDEMASAFNLYRKNQRNKTFFMRLMKNGLDNRNQFQVDQLTGGLIIFPYKNDDRFQVDIGGTYDALKDTSLTNKTFYSRVTFRPKKYLWLRIGHEYKNGFAADHSLPYQKISDNANYLACRFNISKFSLLALAGTGKIDNDLNTRYGIGGMLKGSFNTYFFGGYIKSSEELENVRTLAAGRWSPFRPDGLPSGFFIWKHRENYDFQLGGVFWGGNNSFVRPAAVGITQGIFISSAALSENSRLRRRQLMIISDDYRDAEISFFYVYMDQGIEMSPGSVNHVGFKAFQLFKVFNEINLPAISNPVIGVFYNEETEPEFNPATHSFKEKISNYWAYQLGITIYERFVLNAINNPEKSEWTIALSYIFR